MTITANGHEYRVADTHAHVYKQKIAAKATQAIGSFYRTDMFEPEPTSEHLVSRAGTGPGGVGVDRFLVFSVATRVDQVAGINDFIAAECAAHPQFVGLGTAHADIQDWDELFDQLARLGLRGVKLHPDMQRFNIDDPRLLPLYRGCAARGLRLLFHVGDERYEFSAPERLVRVLDAVPDLRVHAAHMGCCRIWRRRPVAIAQAVRAGADIVFDTSSMISWATPDEMRFLIDLLGPDRTMWGTDYPMWSPRGEFDALMRLGYDPATNQQILWETFARFYEA